MYGRFETRDLDRATIDYLNEVDESAGQGRNGVFLRGSGAVLSTRILPTFVLLLGVAAIGCVGFRLSNVDADLEPRWEGTFQAAVLAFGLLATVASILALRKSDDRQPLGFFWWADGRWLWLVDGLHVQAVPLVDLSDITCTHMHHGHRYEESRIELRGRGLNTTKVTNNRYRAEELTKFLNAARVLLETERRTEQTLFTDSPEMLGAVALRIAESGPEVLGRPEVMMQLKPDAPIPVPETVERAPDEADPKGSERRWMVATGLAIAAGFVLLPGANAMRHEQRLFAATEAAPVGTVEPYVDYLKSYSTGRRADAVRERFEKSLYDHALAAGRADASRMQLYVTHFPDGERRRELEQTYENRAFEAAVGSRPGEEEAFAAYERMFPEGARRDEVRAAHEDNLHTFALESPLGEAEPYERYLSRFPEGANAASVREAFEKNLREFAHGSAPGQSARYERYLAEFDDSTHAAEVRTAFEENLHDFAVSAGDDNTDGCDRYLRAFPTGRYVSELHDLRDDRRFGLAETRTKRDESPMWMRRYLSDPENVRHRTEARDRVAGLYDAVVADIRKRAETSDDSDPDAADPDATDEKADDEKAEPAHVDEQLLAAMVHLLEGMKLADGPNVALRFEASQQVEPGTVVGLMEKFQTKGYLEQHPELVDREKQEGTAMLGVGEVFDEEQIRRREAVVLDRFREAIGKVVRPEIVSFVKPDEPHEASIDVAYNAFPPGQVFVYVKTTMDLSSGTESSHAVGLLRGYHITWKVRVSGPGSEDPHEFEITSNPASSLRYDSRPGDPDWAPYAILLYSAFYDMSDRFIRGFALDPGPAPETYRFDLATGIETYTLQDLVSAVKPVLRNPRIRELLEGDDFSTLQMLVGEAASTRFGGGDPSDLKGRIETLLDRYPGLNRVVMEMLRKQLETRERNSARGYPY